MLEEHVEKYLQVDIAGVGVQGVFFMLVNNSMNIDKEVSMFYHIYFILFQYNAIHAHSKNNKTAQKM